MARQERMAWFNLSVATATVVAFVILLPIVGMPRAMAAFGVMGLCGLSPLLAVRWRGSREPIGDERDRLINSRAMLLGYSVFWMFFVLACMVPFTLYGPEGTIRVEVLPMILAFGWLVLSLTGSVATIVQYRRGSQHAHG